jgi:hypothetical protein
MSTCKSTNNVLLVGGGFSENGRPWDSLPVFLEFDDSSSSNDRLIRRMFVSLDPNGMQDLECFAANYARSKPLQPSSRTRNSTECGRGDVVVVSAGELKIQNVTEDARIVITDTVKDSKATCASPRRIALAKEVEDFSEADAIRYIKAIKAAG